MKSAEEMDRIRQEQHEAAELRQAAIDRGIYDDFGNLVDFLKWQKTNVPSSGPRLGKKPKSKKTK